jgi:transcriptional regulator with XRE-family HTH domain
LVTDSRERQLGRIIKLHRESAGLSQEQFAERAGLHRTYISQIERGLKSPSIRVLTQISAAIGCKAWVLLKEASKD